MATEKRLLRIYPDLAERLDCSRSKAYEVAREIGVVRIGGRAVRVPSGALDRWMDAREQEALEASATHQSDRPAA